MSKITDLSRFMFATHLREHGHDLTRLGTALSKVTEPFEVTASLYGDELSEGFIHVYTHQNRYQVLYFALNKDNEFYLTTSPKTDEAYIPVTNIYDYYFERSGSLRDELGNIAKTYMKEFRQFVFNHTHKYIATMITGGIQDVAIIIAPERKGD